MPVDLAEVADPSHSAVLTMEIQRGVIGDLTAFPQLADAAARVGVVANTARLLRGRGPTGCPSSTAPPSSGRTGPARR